MKKVLLILAAVISLAAPSLQADTPIWYDVLTNYPGGGITTNSGGLWYAHPPGALTPADLLVVTNTYTSGAAVNGILCKRGIACRCSLVCLSGRLSDKEHLHAMYLIYLLLKV